MNLTDLNIHAPTDRSGDGSTLLSHFQALQELELVVSSPGIIEAAILSSVRSTGIQKVSLVYHFFVSSRPRRVIDWKIFDEPLCHLVDQLGCARRLGVDFRIITKGVMETGEVARVLDSLAGFREKG